MPKISKKKKDSSSSSEIVVETKKEESNSSEDEPIKKTKKVNNSKKKKVISEDKPIRKTKKIINKEESNSSEDKPIKKTKKVINSSEEESNISDDEFFERVFSNTKTINSSEDKPIRKTKKINKEESNSSEDKPIRKTKKVINSSEDLTVKVKYGKKIVNVNTTPEGFRVYDIPDISCDKSKVNTSTEGELLLPKDIIAKITQYIDVYSRNNLLSINKASNFIKYSIPLDLLDIKISLYDFIRDAAELSKYKIIGFHLELDDFYSSFEPCTIRYLTTILAKINTLRLTTSTSRNYNVEAVLRSCKSLTSLYYDIVYDTGDDNKEKKVMDYISTITNLVSLEIVSEANTLDLSKLTKLRKLSVNGVKDINVKGLNKLNWLSLKDVSKVRSLKPCPKLESLFVENKDTINLKGLHNLKTLHTFKVNTIKHIEECEQLQSVSIIEHNPVEGKLDFTYFIHLRDVKLINIDEQCPISLRGILSLQKVHIEQSTLRHIDVNGCSNLKELTVHTSGEDILSKFNVKGCSKLQHLDVVGEYNFKHFEDCIDLRYFSINCDRYSLDLNKCKHLKELHILCQHLSDNLDFLSKCKKLVILFISSQGFIGNIKGLSKHTLLENLILNVNLNNNTRIDISPLSGCIHLRRVNIDSIVENLYVFSKCTKLISLCLKNVITLEGLEQCTSLVSLQVKQTDMASSRIIDLSSLTKCLNLRNLSIISFNKLRTLSGLDEHTNLLNLELTKCKKLDNILALKSCTALGSLKINHCNGISATSLLICISLYELHINNKVTDRKKYNILEKMPNLALFLSKEDTNYISNTRRNEMFDDSSSE